MRSFAPFSFQRIKDDRQKIADFAPLRAFKLRRDKFDAHFDKEYFFSRERLNEDAPITWTDLENVLELGKEILHFYSSQYDEAVDHIEPLNVRDVDYILDRLHRSLEGEINERSSEG
jgi:hypothetical protein